MSKSKIISIIVLSFSLFFVLASVIYMDHLSTRMAEEERHRVSIWATATQMLIQAEEGDDIDFISQIIEDNTSIPVYMVDADGHILGTRNVKHPVADPTSLHGPIEMRLAPNNVQYIYYDDSNLLFQLRYFPLVQVVLIVIFLVVAFITLFSVLSSEQDKVWVGLSKETAHQLGTPISSLNAWQELLEMKYPNDPMIPEMRRDIERLDTVAARFSKVGSAPVLMPENPGLVLSKTIGYMATRFGKRVLVRASGVEEVAALGDEEQSARLSAALFSWVIENLMKNAVDAGATEIDIRLSDEGERWQIDVTDNGKGIPGRRPNKVFEPGYTTKQRGWGLGLSLSKRIVEDYHRGQLLLQRTEVGVGTTFRVLLKKAKDS